MRNHAITVTTCLAIGLVGCASGPELQKSLDIEMAARREDLKRPGVKAYQIGECSSWLGGMTSEVRTAWSKLTGIPPASMPRIFCERYVNGIVSGRLGYNDVRALTSGEYTPQSIKVLKGG